ncbi:methyltransferase domain-containing protein [Alteromonas gilva]|uniref:Methyltransferase domain-containing protein n=1 Tax=Alteromonas gilva TaxID=2987522 RepID=A0ABT5L7H6_9ALTE|nr:methyltransferase domain-containing protein [Alteromonas gilva]MDC8831772.1 methyltransferase domain-containing protein [Alteromonas gilva]
MALIEPEPYQLTRKVDVARRFSKAATDYEQFANIQLQIASKTLSRLTGLRVERALDIGCGTGRHTAELAGIARCTEGLDLAPGMVEVARQQFPHILFVQGDAEQLPWTTPRFDIVYSSMALQWCQSPMVALAEIHRVLMSRGRAELAIMVDGSFAELVTANRKANAGLQLNRLSAAQDWLNAAQQAGFTVTRSDVMTYTDTFTSLVTLLRSIKCVGAGSPTNKKTGLPVTRSRLKAVEQAMACTATGQLSNSYQVLHLSLEKPE